MSSWVDRFARRFAAALAAVGAGNGAQLVAFQQPQAGAVARTVDGKLREIKSFADFGVIADGSQAVADTQAAVNAAWSSALANGHDLVHWGGTIDMGDQSFPWRQAVLGGALLDCKDVTIYGTGRGSIFKTTSAGGADVFQLNGVKNLHFRNLRIEATLTGAAGSGSNAVSITGGFDNVSLLDVWMDNLPSLDKGDHIDGGKALTIQCDAAALEVGKLHARIFAVGCSQGFGCEFGLVNFLGKKVSVDVDVTAEDCFAAVALGAAAATGAVPAGTQSGVRVKAKAINCQKDVLATRVHGVKVACDVVTTKTEAARRLSPSAVGWYAADTVVEALRCTYAKNSEIAVRGNKGACAYKAAIGNADPGLSGLSGSTEFCSITLDLAGAASIIELAAVDNGFGTPVASCDLVITPTTAPSFHALFATEAAGNTLVRGPARRLLSPQVAGKLSLALGADGTTETGSLDQVGNITTLQGKATAVGGSVVVGLADAAGTLRLGIINGTGIVVDGVSAGAAIGAYVGKQAVYNSAGALLGYFPIYA